MGATEKISITIGRDELLRAKKLASRLGLSLSTFISEAVRERVAEQVRREAGEAVLATFSPEDRASPDEMSDLLTRWGIAEQRAPRPRGVRHKASARYRKKRSAT